jgi:hypothetical protein
VKPSRSTIPTEQYRPVSRLAIPYAFSSDSQRSGSRFRQRIRGAVSQRGEGGRWGWIGRCSRGRCPVVLRLVALATGVWLVWLTWLWRLEVADDCGIDRLLGGGRSRDGGARSSGTHCVDAVPRPSGPGDLSMGRRRFVRSLPGGETYSAAAAAVAIVAACANQINAAYGAYLTPRDALGMTHYDDIALRDAKGDGRLLPEVDPVSSRWSPPPGLARRGKVTSARSCSQPGRRGYLAACASAHPH